LVALMLFSCGNRQAEPPQSPAATAPAPQTPAAGDQVAQAPPPAAPPTANTAPAAQPVEKPVSKPKPAPTPKPVQPPPKPEPVAKTIPAGTDLNVELLDGASSLTSHVGDAVRARVSKAIIIDGLTVVPEGAIVAGTITEAISLKKIGGKASLGLKFDSLDLAGGQKATISVDLHEQGKSETGKDAGTIAGATAGGALLGRLLSHHDKTKGTLIGAAVGAAAGTGVAAATKGKEVELPAGTALALHLDQPLTVTVQP
jgi:hypothetical protein